MSEQCPRCGAAKVSVLGKARYECGSFDKNVNEGSGFFESHTCLSRQLEAAERRAAEAEAKLARVKGWRSKHPSALRDHAG